MHTTKRFLLLTSCAWCIAFAQNARADYVGLEVLDRSDLTICQDTTESYIPYKMDVCEVHVVLDDSADRLVSTAFSNVSSTAQQGFFQHTLGGNTAPACSQIALEPTLECDSFITLGLECDRGGSTTDPDFDSVGFNNDGEVRGGWYNSAPSNGQGDPDANDRVMIARFSYKQNKNTSGDVCVFAQLGGSKDITAFLLEPFDCSVPGMQGGGAASAPPADFFVDDDCSPPTDGSESDPYCTIQEGIDATAVPPTTGEIVQVAPGTYFETIDFKNRKIIVRSSGGADVTTIDAAQTGRAVTLDGLQGLETVLDGFTVTGGQVTSDPLGGAGMLIVSSDPTIINCTFTDNHTLGFDSPGAGMYLKASDAEITNCTFSGNTASGGAGGICNNTASLPTITNCIFSGNTAQNGGGMGNRNGSDATVTDCEFIDNTASGLNFSGGGGMYNNGSAPTVTNCTFSGNSAANGGGMANSEGSDPQVIDCVFTGNTTVSPLDAAFGGGMYNKLSSPTVSSRFFNNTADYGGGIFNNTGGSPVVINSLFSGNIADDAGGGMFNSLGVTLKAINCIFDGNKATGDALGSEGGGLGLYGPATVTNCTFSNNTVDDLGGSPAVGGALWIAAIVTVDNCVMWGDSATDEGDEIFVRFDGDLTIDFSDAEGGEAAVFVEVGGVLDWKDGNIGELAAHDPKFSAASEAGFILLAGSPCIDSGINAAPGLVGITTDFDGLPRFVQDPDTIDCPHVPDPSACGDPPIVDMGAFEAKDCTVCPADVDGDGEVGPFDLASLLGNWGPVVIGQSRCFDVNDDGQIGALELANLLGSWGLCP